jgi:hypothetical protein
LLLLPILNLVLIKEAIDVYLPCLMLTQTLRNIDTMNLRFTDDIQAKVCFVTFVYPIHKLHSGLSQT